MPNLTIHDMTPIEEQSVDRIKQFISDLESELEKNGELTWESAMTANRWVKVCLSEIKRRGDLEI